MRIVINGFGRIGRCFLRVLLSHSDVLKKITVVAINLGPDNPEHAAHLLKYDSVMGPFSDSISYEGGYLVIKNIRIKLLTQIDVRKINWSELNIDWVVDCSGRFTTRELAAQHIDSGASHVLISAPATGDDVTIIPGVNDDAFDFSVHRIVSLGSCSTNALVPLLKILHVACGIKEAHMTSIHSYTNSQSLLDGDRKDLRRARAAALNIIPTSSGATKTVEKVLPELTNKLTGYAVRVPVPNVSLMDLTAVLEKEMTREKINELFLSASKHAPFKGILGFTQEPLVSTDYIKNSFSVTVDGLLTTVNGSSVKMCGWYDNEWGYCSRLKDFLMTVSY
ncbi:MAG TPA: type I glyceraldehyde-3-phosphate dehydrogenase [Candidatus Babeliales bacterium]|nr:type I glyceraldehyde-3-phosphate dehydrogenase [Candidatus Babeliales bacterium]